MYGQFRHPDAATLLQEFTSEEQHDIHQPVDLFLSMEWEDITSEFWVVSYSERAQFLDNLTAAGRQAFANYDHQDDFLIACEWHSADKQWAVFGVFNSFYAEIEEGVELTSHAYWYSALTNHNSFRQIFGDLIFNTAKPGFPTQEVVELLVDMRSNANISPEDFLLRQLNDEPGWSPIDDIPRAAIEEYLAHRQAQRLSAAVQPVAQGQHAKRKI